MTRCASSKNGRPLTAFVNKCLALKMMLKPVDPFEKKKKERRKWKEILSS
jgi:hypothetical protein